MSEEKNIIELENEDLEQVAGGFGYAINKIDTGDCLRYGAKAGITYLMCRKDYTNVKEYTSIEFDVYNDTIDDAGYRGIRSYTSKTLVYQGFGFDLEHSNKHYTPR